MSDSWRLIVDGPVEGAVNMARDRAVQLARESGTVPATVRLYSWSRPTVTLGRFQSVDAVDLEFCRRNGIDVVRRFTGGRGVLHADEVTYSVVAGVADGVPRGVAASYRTLCEALVHAFGALGVASALTTSDQPASSSGACYLQTTRADLTCGTAKLSGSAQVWHGSTVLQHGSFVLTRDVELEARIFGLTEMQMRTLEQDSATIVESSGRRPTRDEVVRAVAEGFSAVFGVELALGTVSEAESTLEASLLPMTSVG